MGAMVRVTQETADPRTAARGAATPQRLTRQEAVLVRDLWNKFLPFDAMLAEMFYKRLLIEQPDLVDKFGVAVDTAHLEFLRLFDLAVQGLCPAAEHALREAYRGAPAAADARCATIAECGAFFAAHGLTRAHWETARAVMMWLAPQIPYAEARDREDVAKGESSAFYRFFTMRVIEPVMAVADAEAEALDAAVTAEMRGAAEAMAARHSEAGAAFYGALFEQRPEILPLFGAADMPTLSRHLIQTMAFLARAATEPETWRREAQTLAATHRLHRAPPDSYWKLAEPLLETIARFGGPMSAAARDGWSTLLRRVMLVMAQPMLAEQRLLSRAREFLEQIAEELEWTPEALAKRWAAIEAEVRATGTYTQTTEELSYGAKLAWRNAPKCIGRISWRNMTVRDRRHVDSPDAIFAECAEHLRVANNGGAVEIVMTVFAPTRPGERWGPRIWNQQLIRFAGYRQPDGSVLGDGANVALTEALMRLGWTPPSPRGAFDVLPVAVDVPGQPPKLYAFDPADVLMVDIEHPANPKLGAMGLRWCAVPAISNFRLEIGGLNYGCLPFNGWFMGTEIARNLWEENRYGRAEAIAEAFGLDTTSEATLWRDRAFLELNVAVLHSFQKARVMLVDHQTASRQFMAHDEREKQAGRECPAQWSWIAPAAGGSTTPVWHHEMRDFHLRPCYVTAADRWAVMAGEVGRGVSTADKPSAPAASPLILYASETGTAEGYARQAARRLSRHGARATAMDRVDPETLASEKLLLIVTSTFRDGEAPSNGAPLLAWLQGQPPGALRGLRYAVMGIGNRIYPKFCAAATAFDSALADLGAQRIAVAEKADELAGQADAARRWIDMMATLVDAAAPETGTTARVVARALATERGAPAAPTLAPGETLARVVLNEEMLRAPEGGRSTRRIVLDMGPDGPDYETGDHVAVHPVNDRRLTDALSRRLGFDPEAWFRLEDDPAGRYADPTPLRQALGCDLDLAMPSAPDELIAAMIEVAGDPAERTRLEGWRDILDLSADDPRREALRERLAGDHLTVLDLLEAHPSAALRLGTLVELCPRLKPRYYSITSSPDDDARLVEITIGVAQARAADGRTSAGVCSGHLAGLARGATVRLSVSRPGRKLPARFDGPLLMVAAGTGVSPLIGVLRDRARLRPGATGPAALYFGCRTEGEFLYERELTRWRETGVLSRLGVAFSSRDRKRAYVQDVVDGDGEAVWRVLSTPGARIMVCGDARMADEVRERLIDVIQREGGMSAVAAAGMISAMRRDGRYVEDVWGVQLNRAAAITEIARARYSQGALWLERMRRAVGVVPPGRGAHRLI